MNRKQRRAQGGGGAAPTGSRSAATQALFAEAGAHHRSGRLREAEAAFRRLLETDPRHAPALHILGVICAQSGRLEEAATLIGKAVTLDPSDAGASYNLGNALSALGRDDAAIAAYERSLRTRPDFAQGWINLASALSRAGRLEAAAHAYREALALTPKDARVACMLGQTLQEAGLYEEATAAYRQALRLGLPDAGAYVGLAGSFRELGETADALAATDRALALDRSSAQVWYARSTVKTFAAGDPELTRMQTLLTMPLSADDRISLEFALGKAWMDAKDVDRAFKHLDEANRRKRATFAYDVRADIARLEAIAETYSADFLQNMAGAGVPSDIPVFIVGMPRSGTTLIEQILASHPQIHGAGELTLLDEAIARTPGPLTAKAATAIGRDYISGVTKLAPDARRIVDKLPANFRHAGLIGLTMPNARIIHCRRDPIDTCLSCYSRNFVEGVDFACDLTELGLYHRAYERLMDHWRAVLPPDRFTQVDYEAVVGDLESQARRLIAFCGLDWDDACLRFHETRRDIRTASAVQARQPIYRTSLERWRPYEAHLTPLIEALRG